MDTLDTLDAVERALSEIEIALEDCEAAMPSDVVSAYKRLSAAVADWREES
jgi:hypothetical protein